MKITITASRALSRGISRAMLSGAERLRAAADEMKLDIKAVRERDPAAKSDLEAALLYPGVHAIWAHRVSHALYEKKHYISARAVSQAARFFTGIEIHPGAKLGHGLFIDHGGAVVIGETTEIGDNCTLYQCVTLGGTGKDRGKRHPTLGHGVMVGAGAKILGGFEIGDNAKIAAGAVVLAPVPPNSTAVGIPARTVRTNGERVRDRLDHVHIPDPVSAKINALESEINLLKEKITMLEGESLH